MAFQAVPDAAEIVITYLQNGIQSNNVLHARKPGGYDLGDLIALAVAVDAVVGTDWLPLVTTDATYQQTLVRGLAFVNDQEAVNNASSAVGGDAQEGLPMNVTWSVKKASGLTGRNARGRVYWMGMPSNKLKTNENLIETVYADAVVVAIEAMRIGITASVWTAAIVSRFLANVKRPVGVTFEWTETVAVNDVVDTQRRRLP